MQAKKLNIEPAFIANAAGNLLNPGVTSLAGPVGFTMTQPYIVVSHVRVINIDTSARTFTLYKGATSGSAAGTEVMFSLNTSLPPGQWLDWYGEMRFDSADFLSGVADAASKVVINIDGEIGIS
jgi:hypothetical protein